MALPLHMAALELRSRVSVMFEGGRRKRLEADAKASVSQYVIGVKAILA